VMMKATPARRHHRAGQQTSGVAAAVSMLDA
jgi:hypothetical protein